MKNTELEKIYSDIIKRTICIGRQHSRIRQLMALINNTKPNPRRFCVIEGIWSHGKALKAGLYTEAFIYCPEIINSNEAKELVVEYDRITGYVYQVSKKTFSKLAERDKTSGLVSIVQLKRSALDDIALKKSNLLVILDGIEIPGNMGTILRTMDCIHADAMIICNKRARITHPKAIRASMGACFTIPVIEIENNLNSMVKWLIGHNFRIFLADANKGEPHYSIKYPDRAALVMGSERYGIGKVWHTINHEKVRIPMFSKVTDSLNVGIAATLILYEIGLQQRGYIKQR